MLFTIYLFIVRVDIDALEQLWFNSTIAKFDKKHVCCIEHLMKSNHELKLKINIRNRSLMSEAQEMSHHIQCRMILYAESRAITACVIQKNAFAVCIILTVSCIKFILQPQFSFMFFFSFRGIVATNLLQERKSNVYLYHYAIYGKFLLKYSENNTTKNLSLKHSNLNQYNSKPQLRFSSQKLGQQMISL